jgi:hypothetical protein
VHGVNVCDKESPVRHPTTRINMHVASGVDGQIKMAWDVVTQPACEQGCALAMMWALE